MALIIFLLLFQRAIIAQVVANGGKGKPVAANAHISTYLHSYISVIIIIIIYTFV